MVRFTSSSVNSAKCWQSHVIARGGQWRNLAPTRTMHTRTIVDVRTHAAPTEESMPWYMKMMNVLMGAQMGMQMFGGISELLGLGGGEVTPEAPKNDAPANDLADTLKKMQDEIDALKKENEELKTKKPDPETETDPTKKSDPTRPPQGGADVSDGNLSVTETNTTIEEEGEPSTTKVDVPKGKKTTRKDKDGNTVVEYYGWANLAKAYGIENTPKFRKWFSETYLNKDPMWKPGEQHFPNTITFDGKNLTFDPNTFKEAPLDTYSVTGGTEGNTKPGTPTKITRTVTTKTYTGSASATIGGKSYSATISNEKFANADEARAALKDQLINQGLDPQKAAEVANKAQIKNS